MLEKEKEREKVENLNKKNLFIKRWSVIEKLVEFFRLLSSTLILI